MKSTANKALESNVIFQEPRWLDDDPELRALIKACVDASQLAGQSMLVNGFRRRDDATWQVSEQALQQVLDTGDDISDIRTNKDISNCLVFHTRDLAGTVMDENVLALRRRVDAVIAERLASEFGGARPEIEVSGHFWYPPGGFMGWHTNLRKPGWRLYVNYAEEPGKSFFRYRDPSTGKILTRIDRVWNLRLFEIRRDAPLWHAIYSDTNRHSFGYKVTLGDSGA